MTTLIRNGFLQSRVLDLTIGDLRLTEESAVSFNIRHDTELLGRPQIITIKNIGSRRDGIIASPGLPYRIEAGFGSQVGVLCSGVTDIIDEDWRGEESTTTVQLLNHTLDSIVVLEWNGALLKNALHELAVSSGFRLAPLLESSVFNQELTWSFSGKAQQAMNWLAEAYDLTVSRACDTLIVFPNGVPAPASATISQQNGMIGRATRTENGFMARMLLNPSLMPLQTVRLQSELFSGVYQLASVTHKGDTRGQDFITEVRGVLP